MWQGRGSDFVPDVLSPKIAQNLLQDTGGQNKAPKTGQFKRTIQSNPCPSFHSGTCTLPVLKITYIYRNRAAFARQVLFVVVVVVRQEMKVWCCFDVILDCCLLE